MKLYIGGGYEDSLRVSVGWWGERRRAKARARGSVLCR